MKKTTPYLTPMAIAVVVKCESGYFVSPDSQHEGFGQDEFEL